MKSILVALAAVAIAGVLLSTGAVVAKGHGGGHGGMSHAGGGGWIPVKNATGNITKDTFGFILNEKHRNASNLVFHARDVNATIKSYQIDKVDISKKGGNWTGEAWGKATGAGKNWTFYLRVTDQGPRTNDTFTLEVTLVDNPAVSMTWKATGLGGGQIWVRGK